MNLKKILLFTAPVALAGFVYLGDAIGISEVVAKTVKQIVTIETMGTYVGVEWFPENHEYYMDRKNHKTNGYIYVYKTEEIGGTPTGDDSPAGSGNRAVYNKYEIKITETETEIEVPDDANVSKVVPAVDPEAENAKRREEAAIEVQKAAEKKTEDFIKEIKKSIEQVIKSATTGTVVIKTDYFTCFTQEMIDLLAANPDLNYEIHYRYKGKRYVVVIPAGTDYSKLEASNGYYGFRYLDSIFGGYEEGTK